MSRVATWTNAVYRWWILRPGWFRILGTTVLFAAIVPLGFWQLTHRSVRPALILTLIGAVLGGVTSAMDERKKRGRRQRAARNTDPALGQVARDYAIYRLANNRYRRGALGVLPLVSMGYLALAVLSV